MLIGVGQRGPVGRRRNAQMFQLAFAGCKTVTDFTQRLSLRKLAVQHGHELSPTGKATRVPLGLVLAHGLLEHTPWKQLEKLGENGTYSIQGGSLLRLKFGSGRTRISIYRNFRPNRNLNLDTSGWEPVGRLGIGHNLCPGRRSPHTNPASLRLPHETRFRCPVNG